MILYCLGYEVVTYDGRVALYDLSKAGTVHTDISLAVEKATYIVFRDQLLYPDVPKSSVNFILTPEAMMKSRLTCTWYIS